MKYPVLLLVIGLAGTVGCQSSEKPAEEAQAFMLSDTMMHRIVLDSVADEPIRNELTLVGKIVADESKVIEVFPLVGGNVEEVNAELGDYVRKGQPLALIRSGEVADFERQMIQAQADLLVAQKNLKSTQELFESKLAPEREVNSAQKEVDNAQAELNRIREVFRIYGLGKTSSYVVKSPIDGFVIQKKINREMQLRSDHSESLFTIGQLSDVWVLANVNESDIGQVKLGMEAQIGILSYPGEVFHGKVDKVFNVLDPETKAMTVRIRLQNAGYKLKPGMHATVKLQFLEGGSMLAIPSRAIIFERSKHWVMVFHSRSNVETRPIEVYRSLGDRAYIREGLKAGERIISKNQLLIYDALND